MRVTHRRRSASGMLALLLVCAAFSPARAQTDEELIRALDLSFNTLVLPRDTAKLVTLYAPTAVAMYPNMAVLTGTPAIVKAHLDLHAMPNIKFSSTPTSIRVSRGGDLATSIGNYKLSFTSPSGPVVDSGSYIEILQKGSDGKWRIVNEIVTSSVPMQQATVVEFDKETTMAMVDHPVG